MHWDRDELTERLHEKGRAEEGVFFGRRERELLARWRRRAHVHDKAFLREVVAGRCPGCGERLGHVRHFGVEIQECPAGHGMWLTEAEMRTLAERERHSWIGRYFYRPRPLV